MANLDELVGSAQGVRPASGGSGLDSLVRTSTRGAAPAPDTSVAPAPAPAPSPIPMPKPGLLSRALSSTSKAISNFVTPPNSTSAIKNFPSEFARHLIPGLADIQDNPEGTDLLTAGDVAKTVPGVAAETAKGFAKAPVAGALDLWDTARVFAGKNPNASFNIPVLGKVSSDVFNVADRVRQGDSPVAAALTAGSQGIFNMLFLADIVNRVAGPRAETVGQTSGNVNDLNNGKPGTRLPAPNGIVAPGEGPRTPIDTGPKSFRLYEPPTAYSKGAHVLPPQVLEQMKSQGVSLGSNFDPAEPVFFRVRVQGDKYTGEIVQLKQSYIQSALNKVSPETGPVAHSATEFADHFRDNVVAQLKVEGRPDQAARVEDMDLSNIKDFTDLENRVGDAKNDPTVARWLATTKQMFDNIPIKGEPGKPLEGGTTADAGALAAAAKPEDTTVLYEKSVKPEEIAKGIHETVTKPPESTQLAPESTQNIANRTPEVAPGAPQVTPGVPEVVPGAASPTVPGSKSQGQSIPKAEIPKTLAVGHNITVKNLQGMLQAGGRILKIGTDSITIQDQGTGRPETFHAEHFTFHPAAEPRATEEPPAKPTNPAPEVSGLPPQPINPKVPGKPAKTPLGQEPGVFAVGDTVKVVHKKTGETRVGIVKRIDHNTHTDKTGKSRGPGLEIHPNEPYLHGKFSTFEHHTITHHTLSAQERDAVEAQMKEEQAAREHLFGKKPTQKEKVAEAVKNEPKSIQEVAKETKILEPNVRRILGVGAKEGTFERVAEGVYVLRKDGKDIAYVQTASAVDALPKLAAEGFKADMVFLDIPYDTPAVRGGNRGVAYDVLSVNDFGKILDAVADIVRNDNAPIIHMFSQAKSGLAAMQKYNDLFLAKGFLPVAKGEYQKTYASGKPVGFPSINGYMITEPEGILMFTKSGKVPKNLGGLTFKLVRPSGYQTEKPAELLKSLIEMTTNEGEVVLDPFAGSGVTGAEAIKLGRVPHLIEKNPAVVENIIKPRLDLAAKKAPGYEKLSIKPESPEEAAKPSLTLANGNVIPRSTLPKQLITKTDLKNILANTGQKSIELHVDARHNDPDPENTMLTYSDGNKVRMQIKPSALGIRPESLHIGQTVTINAADLKEKGSSLRLRDQNNLNRGFVNPGAIAEQVQSNVKAVRDLIEETQHMTEVSENLSDDLYKLANSAEADTQRIINFLEKHTGGITPQEAENLLHYDENKNEALSGHEREVYDNYVVPMKRAITQMREALRDMGVPVGADIEDLSVEHTPRFVKERNNVVDKLLKPLGKQPKTNTGGVLNKGVNAKHRTMKALEGSRQVVYVKDNVVYDAEGKVLGRLPTEPPPKVKEFYDKLVMEKLEKLAESLGITHERVVSIRGGAAGVSYGGKSLIRTRAATPEDVLLHEIGHQIDEKYGMQSMFIDKDLKQLQTQLRALADLRFEGGIPGLTVSKHFARYVRTAEEKMAVMFQAYLHAPDKFQAIAPNLYHSFTGFLGRHPLLKPVLDIKPSLVTTSQVVGKPYEPDSFTDKAGVKHRVVEATVKEIEAQTDLEYHKDAIVNYALTYARTLRAYKANLFLQKLMASKVWGEIAAADGTAIPDGWKMTTLPQLRTWFFEPKTAEVLDDFALRQGGRNPWPIYDAVNNFLTAAIVLNPIMHYPNVALNWMSNENVRLINPLVYPRMARAFGKAFDAVKNKNKDYLTFLERGAPLMSLRGTNTELAKRLLERLSKEVEEDPTGWDAVAKALGYANPIAWIKGLSHFSERATWEGQDLMTMQALYERMEEKGYTIEQAIDEVTKRVADYRVPSRILGSRTISRLAQNRTLFVFSPYHYSGVFKPWVETFKDVKSGDLKRTREGLGVVAFLAVMGLLVYPALDKFFKKVTGSPTTYVNEPGMMKVAQNIGALYGGSKDYAQFIQSLLTLSPASKLLIELGTNTDLYFRKPITGAGNEGIPRHIINAIDPFNKARKVATDQQTATDFFLSMGGIYTPKSTPADLELNNMVYNEKPAIIKEEKARIVAGDLAGADALGHDFNIRLRQAIVDGLTANGKPSTGPNVDLIYNKNAIHRPGAVAMANYRATQGKNFTGRQLANGKVSVPNGTVASDGSIIGIVTTYAKAIGTDPLTAFNDIFHGQIISKVEQGTIIVQRMPLSASQAEKAALGGAAGTKGMTLDHTIPLELGGTNDESNLHLVPADQARIADQAENTLGSALAAGTITKAIAQKAILDYKNGIITMADVNRIAAGK